MSASSQADIWSSLPVPAILIDGGDHIADLNPAAEGFLNASAGPVTGAPVPDRLAIDAPLGDAMARVRADQSPFGDQRPAFMNFKRKILIEPIDRLHVIVKRIQNGNKLIRVRCRTEEIKGMGKPSE